MTTIHVTASREYDVLVQPGLLDDAGAQLSLIHISEPTRP